MRKGRDVLLKMVSQNAGVLWNILDSEGKGYIVFDRYDLSHIVSLL